MKTPLDRRLNAFRPNLADVKLKGCVEAASFAEPSIAHVTASVCDLRPVPDLESGIDTQLIVNQQVGVFDHDEDWAWVQAQRDGYVGYLPCTAIAFGAPPIPTHTVRVPRTFTYAKPDLKSPVKSSLSMGTQVAVSETTINGDTLYARIAPGGWVVANHLTGITDFEDDFVTVAETLLNTPYLWGGCTAFGIDCSGLVQLALFMCGQNVLRDSDMQFESLGHAIDPADGLRRGDLIFWKGHVAIACDAETLIHANGHTMNVAVEKVSDAIDRIAYLYGQPIGYKRL